MTLVVDANVAIKWFVQQHPGPLIAPALMIAETTNGLWRHVVHGDLTAGNAKAAVVGLPRWFNELVEDQSLSPGALELAVDLNYATYDCFYIALSLVRSAPLVTADKKLINRLASTQYASNVIHLSDWA